MNAIVFIETRELPNLQESVERHLIPGWKIHIICSAKNANQFKGYDKMDFVKIGDLYEYNRLLTSEDFWNELPYEKVLICQHDSGLLKDGINEFMEWDYVGAPWWFQNWGGNGGLSLRTVEVMKYISRGAKWQGQNEDVFFCNIMQYLRTAKLAPLEVCEKFSVESVFKLGTLGYHGIEEHLTKEEQQKILNQYER